MGMSVPDLEISRAACTPSICGIEKSINMRSGASWCAFCTASAPSTASPQTCQSEFSSSNVRSPRRMGGLSSAIKIRVIAGLRLVRQHKNLLDLYEVVARVEDAGEEVRN